MIGHYLRFAAVISFLGVTGGFAVASETAQKAEAGSTGVRLFVGLFDAAVDEGHTVGAQLVVGRHDEVLLDRNFGARTPRRLQAVDRNTRFCIGSCSKPFASVCILSLVDEGLLQLDAPIDRWLSDFHRLPISGADRAGRAPTLRELLGHRAGIYSQKRRLTSRQRALIRDFSLTLEESVDGIARQQLIAKPGEIFAYSGAGYCVLGRVAEVATGKGFDEILQERVCRPLGMTRTTYFPPADNENIAVGSTGNPVGPPSNPLLGPHLLGEQLRLPLIGGSIYTTASESAYFARMIVSGGRNGDTRILSSQAWREMTSRQWPRQTYGLGWGLNLAEGEERSSLLSHGGSLASCRSVLRVDLKTGFFLVAHWTIGRPEARRSNIANERSLRQGLEEAFDRLVK